MSGGVLNIIEWLFMPQTHHERLRLDPITRAFKERMRRFSDRDKHVAESPVGLDAEEAPPSRPEERGYVSPAWLSMLTVLATGAASIMQAGSGCSVRPHWQSALVTPATFMEVFSAHAENQRRR